MTIYFLLIGVWGASAFSILSWPVDRVVLVSITMCAIGVAGLRWMSDVDYVPYLEMYDEVPLLWSFGTSEIESLYGEFGYLLATSFFRTFGVEFYFVTFLFACFSIASKAWIANRLTRFSGITLAGYLCIHFITIEFIQIRWAIASSMIMMAYYFNINDRFWRSHLIFLAATTFHYFSIIFWAGSLLLQAKPWVRLATLAVGLVFAIIGSSDFVLSDSMYGSDLYVIKRAVRYMSEELSGVGLMSYLRLVMYVILVFYFIWSLKRQGVEIDIKTNRLFAVANVSLAITLFVSFVPLMHFRAVVIADYFCLAVLCRYAQLSSRYGLRLYLVLCVVPAFCLWYFFDVENYIQADRLYDYTSWLGLIFGR